MANSLRLLPFLALLGLSAPLLAQDAASALEPLNQQRVVRLKTIATDFANNPVAAIAKYSDRRITVIGRIDHLGQGTGENVVLVVTLQNAGSSLPAVKCQFISGSLPHNSEIQLSTDHLSAQLIRRNASGIILSQNTYLSADQKVAIKGSFKEIKVGDVVLTNCKIVPKERQHELRDELNKSQS